MFGKGFLESKFVAGDPCGNSCKLIRVQALRCSINSAGGIQASEQRYFALTSQSEHTMFKMIELSRQNIMLVCNCHCLCSVLTAHFQPTNPHTFTMVTIVSAKIPQLLTNYRCYCKSNIYGISKSIFELQIEAVFWNMAAGF